MGYACILTAISPMAAAAVVANPMFPEIPATVTPDDLEAWRATEHPYEYHRGEDGSRIPHYRRLSDTSASLLSTVMETGMSRSSSQTLSYLDRNWENIIDRIRTFAEGAHTHICHQILAYRTKAFTFTHDMSVLSVELSRHGLDAEGADNMAARIDQCSRMAQLMLASVRNLLQKKHRLECILQVLRDNNGRRVQKLPLFLRDCTEDVCTDGHSLEELIPWLFSMDTPDRSHLTTRRVQWNPRWASMAARYGAATIPAEWQCMYRTEGFEPLIAAQRHMAPSPLGKSRFRIAVLLAAIDSTATTVFDVISAVQYLNWVGSIGAAIEATIGPREPPPEPPLPPINGEMVVLLDHAEDPDDIDPVMLSPFKAGDVVYRMNCCGNRLLETSIRGILASGRTPKCPMCRGALLAR